MFADNHVYRVLLGHNILLYILFIDPVCSCPISLAKGEKNRGICIPCNSESRKLLVLSGSSFISSARDICLPPVGCGELETASLFTSSNLNLVLIISALDNLPCECAFFLCPSVCRIVDAPLYCCVSLFYQEYRELIKRQFIHVTDPAVMTPVSNGFLRLHLPAYPTTLSRFLFVPLLKLLHVLAVYRLHV